MKNTFFKIATALFVTGTVWLSSCTSDDAVNAVPVADKLAPDSASGGSVLTLTGSGLGEMRTIVFDNGNVPAGLNPAFNTDNAIVFRVPDTAFGGTQKIIFTNKYGKSVAVPFKVIALPIVTELSNTDFTKGTQVTVKGNNLNDVTKVLLAGSTAEAKVIAKTKKQMVIEMPASSSTRSKLTITNSSGTITTQQELVSVDNNYGFFKDNFADGIDNWSWGGDFTASTKNVWTGTRSLEAAYNGSWGGLALHSSAGISTAGVNYLTFWAKGADIDRQVSIKVNWATDKVVTIPANVWTYFKIPATGFLTMPVINDFVFQIHDDGKTIYFDNILLVK
ncbi:cell shape determination protein CcmA [Emticicia sp. ODNR4P]|nr:cell shape determination protein CcmA [Emticicia sp. ODNR4P]